MRIEIQDLTKRFGPNTVLDRITLEIRSGEFVGLLGPSGSGKTTLLRILAGLETAEQGTVLFDAQDIQALSAAEREVGFVFQHYALFPHMTVADNIAFGLEVRPRGDRPPKAEIRERVAKLLSLVQLEGLGERFPAQLSGGQRQRVALARTLAIEPKILLLDEPFGALDAKVRVELRQWLRDLHDAMGITTVFVTHDQEEALVLGDRVAVLNRGRIEQIGSPMQVYEHPATEFVYDFLGEANKFACEVKDGAAQIGDKVLEAKDVPDGPAVAYVRPHDVVLFPDGTAEPTADVMLPEPAAIRYISAVGKRARIDLSYRGFMIHADVPRERLDEHRFAPGQKCTVHLKAPRIFPDRRS